LTSCSLALDPYMTSMYPTGHSSMVLDPYMTSMFPTGHSSMVLDPFMMPVYPTGHSSMTLDPYMTSMYPTGYPSFAHDPLCDVNVPHWALQHEPGPLHVPDWAPQHGPEALQDVYVPLHAPWSPFTLLRCSFRLPFTMVSSTLLMAGRMVTGRYDPGSSRGFPFPLCIGWTSPIL
jgi:hypothetical protein